jgi:hypothetical protein
MRYEKEALHQERVMADITNTDVIKAWAMVPQEIIENFGDHGRIVVELH